MNSNEVYQPACLTSSNGGFPVAISITVQPSDQISAGRPHPCCVTTSGAMKWMVPETNSMVRMKCMCVCMCKCVCVYVCVCMCVCIY